MTLHETLQDVLQDVLRVLLCIQVLTRQVCVITRLAVKGTKCQKHTHNKSRRINARNDK